MHATASINGTTIADTDSYEVVDGNIYFPPASLTKTAFTTTSTHTTCPYKGKASYYTIEVDGKTLKDSAWYYPEPKSGYEKIKGFVAFYGSKVDVVSE
ncbi:DUF427-domain-containing protein [Lindgomyces ingoldianus]|uniref:DUF427-domain-containing protein n=1 Tax=Lindgomyces ingoldianus TaxID=673940 RepID=A0ACB6R8R7_9PLEO|nr:DUF427-domain-containing protein [Lindgomyces ingoldianus]KAF2475163.1 DUF427-domain-containing protein [Lindgomyces ingoldianus]